MQSINSSGSNGFRMKQRTPCAIACCFTSGLGNAVISISGTASLRSIFASSRPLVPGICTSLITRSNRRSRSARKISAEPKVMAWMPMLSMRLPSADETSSSSSTTAINRGDPLGGDDSTKRRSPFILDHLMPDRIDKKHCAGVSRRHPSIVQRLARSVEPYRGIGARAGTGQGPPVQPCFHDLCAWRNSDGVIPTSRLKLVEKCCAWLKPQASATSVIETCSWASISFARDMRRS